ncbi:MAG: mannose-1-phosphate guanylyltransferase [Bacteroidales bacterium]|nr:mannose-1-phosphate guanylyltransferase [Bacteroidales bacterium]
MNSHYYCIIMAGGSGDRFWPLSRENNPKQFLGLTGDSESFLVRTYEMCQGIVPKENILVITLGKYRSIVEEQLPDLDSSNLLLEPIGKKTAPCVAYATYEILRRDPRAVMAMTPCDIIIKDWQEFRNAMTKALDYAEHNDILMTLGITPTHPDTNYGYIQIAGGASAMKEDIPVKVKTFTEKPPQYLADVFCTSGEFLWNSGIFVWQAAVIREELEKYLPEITNLFTGWETALGSDETRGVFLERIYSDCKKISIDYGVMEKTERAWLFPARFEWYDIDSWDTLYNYYPDKDSSNNACNSTRPYFEDDKDSLILTTSPGKLLAIKGLKDYIVVDTDDVLLICPKDDKDYKDFITGLGMPGFEDIR